MGGDIVVTGYCGCREQQNTCYFVVAEDMVVAVVVVIVAGDGVWSLRREICSWPGCRETEVLTSCGHEIQGWDALMVQKGEGWAGWRALDLSRNEYKYLNVPKRDLGLSYQYYIAGLIFAGGGRDH